MANQVNFHGASKPFQQGLYEHASASSIYSLGPGLGWSVRPPGMFGLQRMRQRLGRRINLFMSGNVLGREFVTRTPVHQQSVCEDAKPWITYCLKALMASLRSQTGVEASLLPRRDPTATEEADRFAEHWPL
jgi:hypothetical protein